MARPAVVVVSYRTPERIEACIEAIRHDEAKVPVYLADNASRQDELLSILGGVGNLHDLSTTANPGFAAALNRGVERAFADGAEHVLVLNDDVILRKGAISALVEASGSSGVAAPWLDGPPSGRFRGGRIDWARGLARHEDGASDYLCGACLMISRQAWSGIGPFDEGYFLYFEDVDWSVRARACDIPLVIVPQELALHDGGASTGGEMSPIAVYWWTRSRIRFVRKHRGTVDAARITLASVGSTASARLERAISGRLFHRRGSRMSNHSVRHPKPGRNADYWHAKVRGIVSGWTHRIR